MSTKSWGSLIHAQDNPARCRRALTTFAPLAAQQAPDKQIPPNFSFPQPQRDYDKRVVMVPMRDGTKLYTVIVVPKGATNAPIVLTRTPYNAEGRAERIGPARRCWPRCRWPTRSSCSDGYIRVYQDIRGKYGSEGDYVVDAPGRRPAQPDARPITHRRLGHDRLAGEQGQFARNQRQGRHDRLVLRRLHGGRWRCSIRIPR